MSTAQDSLAHGMPGRRRKLRLGDLLVQCEVLSDTQLQTALAAQQQTGQKLGSTLIELDMIDEDGLLQFLSRQLSIPVIELAARHPDPDVVRRLPESMARRYRAILLEHDASEGDALLGMADPTDLFAFDAIGRALGCRVRQAVVREGELLDLLDHLYSDGSETAPLAETLGGQLAVGNVDLGRMLVSADAEESPVYRLLHRLFEDAVRSGASDIHIEPDEKVLRLRQRIDGVLHEQVINEQRIAPALVQRLKVLAGLDIAERHLPQDGRFHIKVQRHQLDVRLSTLPTAQGEALVMHLLDQTAGPPTLDQLGMDSRGLSRVRSLLRRPHGLLLVNGPAGSGKTTTLYAGLHELNAPDRKIISIEDPIEYQLPRINQVQVCDQIGLDFSSLLRTSLRQDPDVLLIGELRDLPTVEIGLHAALAGHLVLSSLQANGAAASLARLLEMGARGYLLASSLNALLTQRLVRRLCEHCCAPAAPDECQSRWLESRHPRRPAEEWRLQRGSGCAHCGNSGYRGRIGIYELLDVDATMADALRDEDPQAVAAAIAARDDYRSLGAQAMQLAERGRTSLEEVIRIHGEL